MLFSSGFHCATTDLCRSFSRAIRGLTCWNSNVPGDLRVDRGLMVFPENTPQPKSVNKPEVRQHNSKHQRNDKVWANHIFLHSVSCHQAPQSHSYSRRLFEPDGIYDASAMPMLRAFCKSLIGKDISAITRRLGRIENLKTRKSVEGFSES